MADKQLMKALAEARVRELRAAELYRQLSERERDPRRKDVLRRLSEAEARHAEQFGERIAALGGTPGSSAPKLTPGDKLALQTMGVEAVLRRMEAEEEKNMAYFAAQAEAIATDPASAKLFTDIEAEEEEHTAMLRRLPPSIGGQGGPDSPHSRLEAMFRREKWHVTTGSWIGDAIYGVNDGLGAVFGIVSGMAGYTGGGHQVVVAGLFGMLASALSMGSGAYLATKSEREVYEAEIAREKREIEESPEHETEELALIYELKGFTPEQSREMAATVAAQPEQFLKTMAQEELGLSHDRFPSPWVAMGSATLSTAIGAVIPVIPFFFTSGIPAVIGSAVISTLAHFAVGAAKSMVTARSWFASGMEMTVVGVVEAVITYGLGLAFKVA